jgi:predicted secreted protein
MKKFLLSSLFIIPTLLSAYELEFTKSFNKDIQNDKLRTNISINIESKDVNYINNKIGFFQNFIDDEKSVTKKNGNYKLLPKYSYKNKQQTFIGYKGSLDYIIESSEYERLNDFITNLHKMKKKVKTQNIKLSISNLQWIVSKELYEKNIDTMRIESIKWIKNYATNLNDNCIIKRISINQNNNYRTQRYSKNVMLESSNTFNVTPSQSEQSITLKTNYSLECK